MKTLIETTIASVAASMNLKECGDYAGKFQDEAYAILNQVGSVELEENCWCDIMYDRDNSIYAIWADDSLTCYHAEAKYIEIEREDCPEAFEGMEYQLNN